MKYAVECMKVTKDVAIRAKDRFADKMIDFGTRGQVASMDPVGFMMNEGGNLDVKAGMSLIVGGIVIMKLASTMLPQANADWTAATAAGGVMANASAADKSTWNTGGSLIPVFGVIIVAGIAMRAFGK